VDNDILYKEEAREIEVIENVDVLIAGGGCAGVIAAIASARTGARTILVERYGFLGGTITAGMLLSLSSFCDRFNPYAENWTPSNPNAPSHLIISGIPLEFMENVKRERGTILGNEPEEAYWNPVDPEVVKLVAQEMVLEAGVKLLFHSLIVDVIKDGNELKGIIIESKSGRQAIRAKIIVDATGDGDVYSRAGAQYEKGDAEGKFMPVSMLFRLGGVRVPKYPAIFNCDPLETHVLREGAMKGKHNLKQLRLWVHSLPVKDQVWINGTRIANVDGTDIYDLTKAEIKGRRQVWNLYRFLKENLDTYRESYILSTACQVAIRETRRLIGKYILTAEDILNDHEFDDAICRGSYPIDIHLSDGSGVKLTYREGGTSYTIPYRCLLPLEVENLLVAGRSISVTREALGSMRVVSICMATGHAAGIAAALSINNNVTPRNLDVKLLQYTLKSQGAILENPKD